MRNKLKNFEQHNKTGKGLIIAFALSNVLNSGNSLADKNKEGYTVELESKFVTDTGVPQPIDGKNNITYVEYQNLKNLKDSLYSGGEQFINDNKKELSIFLQRLKDEELDNKSKKVASQVYMKLDLLGFINKDDIPDEIKIYLISEKFSRSSIVEELYIQITNGNRNSFWKDMFFPERESIYSISLPEKRTRIIEKLADENFLKELFEKGYIIFDYSGNRELGDYRVFLHNKNGEEAIYYINYDFIFPDEKEENKK